MTAKATVKQAEWRRMAAVSKETGMTTWVEIDGKKYGVSPVIPDIHSSERVETSLPTGSNALSEWRRQNESRFGGRSLRQEKAR